MDLHLASGEGVIVQKDGLMCTEKSVDLDIHSNRRIGTGFFGAEGFIMESVVEPGIAFLEFDRDIVEMQLASGSFL